MNSYNFNIDQLNQIYSKWNQENIKLVDHGDFVEIITPFVDNHHDLLHVVMYHKDNQIVISDDGYTLNELKTYEIDYKKSTKRQEFLNQTLNSFGVKISLDSELLITINSLEEYPTQLFRILQCIIRISDMMLTSRTNITSIFFEEVSNLFEDYDIRAISDVSITGKTGNANQFDFIIPRSKKKVEKIIKTINNPTKEAYKSPLLSFLDIKENRSNSEFIVIANDDNKIDKKFLTSLANYEIEVLRWSKKDDWVKELA
ncbi:DUF1829 domain-containing protein [Kurthia sp. Dielmo]|uniref:DUF1829 domain-containing protein n=1 Tax=Kurthia sp. Dielmo TaxID=1033738 RepID=UPI0011239FC0|nr:DUF1829 domain-containing protein [Kurthia sp. Dielmo]